MAKSYTLVAPKQSYSLSGEVYDTPAPPGPVDAPEEPVRDTKGNLAESAKATSELLRGTAETVAGMASSFVGALPASLLGMYDAVKNKDINKFPEAFGAVQEAFKAGPWSKEGKEVSAALEELMSNYSEQLDKYLVEPNLKNGNALTATMGKVSGEALPLLLPFLIGKGKANGEKGKPEPTPESPPLEGEFIPKEEAALREQNARLEPPTEIPTAERVSPEQPLVSAEQKLLPAPEPAPAQYTLVPKAAQESKIIDFELAKAKKNTIAEWTDWKDIEEITLEDPYKKGGALESDTPPTDPNTPINMYSGFGGFEETKLALAKVWEHIDNTNAMHEWKVFTRPLQSGDAFTAGIVKDFANLKRVHVKERMDQLTALDKISTDTRETMIKAIENPNLREQLSPELNAALDGLIKENEDLSQTALDMGIIGNIRKPYAPHIIKTAPEGPWAERLIKQGYIKTGIKPAGTRKYSTFEEGEAKGIKYVKDIKVLADINYQLKDAIIGRHFINYVKQWSTGSEELIGPPGVHIEQNYVKINHPAFQEKIFIKNESVSYGDKNYYAKDGKITIEDKVYPVIDGEIYINGKKHSVRERYTVQIKDMMVHKDIAEPLRAVLEADNPALLTKGLTKLKAATIGIIVYNPAFHGITILSRIIPSLPGAGFGEHIWNPKKIIGADVYEQLSPAAKAATRTWVSDYVVGNYLMGVDSKVVEAMKHNVVFIGGRGYRADLYGEIEPFRKNVLQRFAATENLGKAIEKFGDFWHGTLLWDRIADAQMGLYNRFSITFAENAVKKFTETNKRPPDVKELEQLKEDAKYLAGEFANTVAGSFGKEDFGNAWKHFLNTALISRSLTMSNVRLAEYGLGVMPKHLQGQVKLLENVEKGLAAKVFIGYAGYTILKDLFLMLGTLYGLNYAFTKYQNIPDKQGKVGGHFPQDNEPGKELYIAMGQKPDGTVMYAGIPFRSARDMFEMVTMLPTVLYNKLNYIPKTLWEEVTNTNWKGKPIRQNLGGSTMEELISQTVQTASHLSKGLTGWESTFNTFNPDDESWMKRFNLLGLQISQGTPGGMVAGNLRSIHREQQARKDLVMAEALDLSKRGKDDKAKKLIVDNQLADAIPGFVLRSKDPGASLLLNLDLGSLYIHATPKQKEELNQIKFGRKAP